MTKGKTPSLISGSSGKPTITFAKNKSKCFRCGVIINGGSRCVDIPKPGAFTTRRRCCIDCFLLIVAKTKVDVQIIEDEISSI